MTNLERIEFILEDVQTISAGNPMDHHNLIKTLLDEDMMWLMEYVEKVENFIKIVETQQIESVTFMGGYMSAIRDLKRELDEITP